MNLTVTTDPAVKLSVSGVDYLYPRLEMSPDIDDLTALIKGAREETIESRARQCGLQPFEKFRCYQELDNSGVNIFDVLRYAKTAKGVRWVCDRSAKRAAFPESEHADRMRRLGLLRMTEFAVDLVSAADPEIPKPTTNAPASADPLSPSIPSS